MIAPNYQYPDQQFERVKRSQRNQKWAAGGAATSCGSLSAKSPGPIGNQSIPVRNPYIAQA